MDSSSEEETLDYEAANARIMKYVESGNTEEAVKKIKETYGNANMEAKKSIIKSLKAYIKSEKKCTNRIEMGWGFYFIAISIGDKPQNVPLEHTKCKRLYTVYLLMATIFGTRNEELHDTTQDLLKGCESLQHFCKSMYANMLMEDSVTDKSDEIIDGMFNNSDDQEEASSTDTDKKKEYGERITDDQILLIKDTVKMYYLLVEIDQTFRLLLDKDYNHQGVISDGSIKKQLDDWIKILNKIYIGSHKNQQINNDEPIEMMNAEENRMDRKKNWMQCYNNSNDDTKNLDYLMQRFTKMLDNKYNKVATQDAVTCFMSCKYPKQEAPQVKRKL